MFFLFVQYLKNNKLLHLYGMFVFLFYIYCKIIIFHGHQFLFMSKKMYSTYKHVRRIEKSTNLINYFLESYLQTQDKLRFCS